MIEAGINWSQIRSMEAPLKAEELLKGKKEEEKLLLNNLNSMELISPLRNRKTNTSKISNQMKMGLIFTNKNQLKKQTLAEADLRM